MVGHTFQYNPAVHALKKMIDSDELGDIYYIDAVRASLGLFHPTLNVIWDLAPHDISILLHLLGDSPATVSARGAACVQESVADVAYMSLMFPKSVLAHIRMSWLDPLKTRRITVIGSKKMVVYDDVDNQEKIKVYDKRVSTIRRTDTFGDFQFAYHYGNIVSPFIHLEEPLRVECLHFAECIRENKTPLTDGLNGLRVVEIIEAAQRSLNNFGVEEAVSTTGGQSVNGRSNTTLSQTHPKAAIAVPGK
jgi:predicted dehydrogenase